MSLGMLAICLGVLAAGATVDVSPERAELCGIEGPSCPLGTHLGEDACPGCGLTRSTALVLQGRWRDAWGLHAGGFVIAFLCCAGVPFHWDVLRRREVGPRHRWLQRSGRALLTLGILVPWILGVLLGG